MDGGSVLESVELVRVGNGGREGEEVDGSYCCDHDGRGGYAILELTVRTERAGRKRGELKVFICIVPTSTTDRLWVTGKACTSATLPGLRISGTTRAWKKHRSASGL